MKPDWDRLATEFDGDPKRLIADVDCTGAGKPLCERFKVEGYPTIKTFAAGDAAGEAYEGGRDFDSLKKHAESLGPACTIDQKENCSEEDLPELEKFAAMSPERRQGRINKLQNALKKEEARHKEVQDGLQKRYDESNKALEALQEKLKPKIRLLQMATPKAS
mmetsp:Transcript_72912/g.121706  ORF Transcript_72912/g.121706 Transcript_72912/m.121706 type:complete len:163 (+) Transcript_72912:185-673(+)|eukprot:CAMPEP_0119300726 /NCGR_PEP_ID=MMETSP1333-20130426/2636_1 /TAXON_ID=418940 /ORGANISM="Scyphosphaera apsteinii, Strain RCC1455" /LENGTH=162 /DNA_ID=CAMNT_0007302605 /DNA_START=198 /DNA_END=686 /DNA_ORIENTATION=-